MSQSSSTNERAKRRRLARPVAVEKVLSSALRVHGLDKRIARYRFVQHWEDIVGAPIAEVAKPECFSRKRLIVRVASAAWMQELTFQKPVILRRLKRFLDDPSMVQDIWFRVDRS